MKNASALAKALMDKGFKLVSDGTDNHLMLLDLSNTGVTGKQAQHMLDEVFITVNKNGIPFDRQSPFITSGVRVGTPAVTSRGMKEEDMLEIAEMFKLTIADFENSKETVMLKVKQLCEKYPLYR